MKKFSTTLAFLLVFTLGFSQNESQNQTSNAESEKNNFTLKNYFGTGLQYTDALEINPFLSESNVPTVRRFPVELALGLTGDFGRNKIDLDFGFYNQEREREQFGHKVNSFQLTLRYLRNIIQFENNNRVFIGAGLNYMTTELEFFDRSNSIDLSDAGSFGGVAKLKNSQFHVGPSVGYSIFSTKENEVSLRIQLTYDINITTNSWDSDYARVSNNIYETGNKFRLQFILPF